VLKEIKLERQVDATVLNEAYQIFSKAEEQGLTKGRPMLGLVYASLYAAHRILKKPILMVEIAKISDITPKKLLSYYRLLLKSLKLTVPMLSPKDFVMEYSKQLMIPEETIKRAISFIESIDKSFLLGKNPRVIAAAALHIACKERKESVTKVQIGKVLKVTPAAIRNFLRKLEV
jgi:transcription initiation factor TFIIB